MFSKKTDTITLSNYRNLDLCCEYILSNSLTNSDDTNIHENYSICMLILAQYINNNPLIPFTVKKQYIDDPPDFIISHKNNSISIALEHTIATTEVYQMATKEMMRNDDIDFLETSYYLYNSKLPKNKAYAGLKKDGEKLTGEPILGNFHVNNWTEIVLNSIIKKLEIYLINGLILILVQRSY